VLWLFGLLGLVIVVVIALVALGRETARLSGEARPAVFDVAQAVEFIADRLPADVQARLSHDDVRWILLADVDLLEDATRPEDEDEAEIDEDPVELAELVDGGDDEHDRVVDEDHALARLLALADASGRELLDGDVLAVLDARLAYLEAIGAIGPRVAGT
jgi:hypothetical protein